ncbi:hypothetical protein [Vagococcus silagei]|uniref:Uncharacterized protein n=1 Tax=Vagococcus silagei TaxID=2508885 RepID=A0A4V6RML1_9ENTE|nr:hypothetical protein [Vagococcus silagei]THB62229.1 hypothetical protein ESZ54_01420 [Vagococcus silagei]
MKTYLKLELKKFLFSAKTIAVLIVLLFLGLYYSLVFIPNNPPLEKIDREQIETQYNERKNFIDLDRITTNLHPSVATALAIFPEWNQKDKARLMALDKEAYKEYAEHTADWYQFSDEIYFNQILTTSRYPIIYYSLASGFGFEDGHYAYKRESAKYQQLAKISVPLTIPAMNEQTAVQVVANEAGRYLPMILIAALIFFLCDIVLMDRKYQTIEAGYPITPLEKLVVKFTVALVGLLLTVVSLLPSFIILSFKYGIGSLKYPIPIYQNDHLNNGHFETISLQHYYLIFMLSFLLVFIFLFLFIIFLSLVFKSEIINIAIPSFLLFCEPLYFIRGVGEFKPVEWYPSTYLKIGSIITGHQNYLYITMKLTVEKMIILFSILIVIFILPVVLFSQRKGRKI